MESVSSHNRIGLAAEQMTSPSIASQLSCREEPIWRNYSGKPYQGPIKINHIWNGAKKRLELQIETERLRGHFTMKSDLKHYKKIFSSLKTMRHYASGAPDGSDLNEV